MPNKRSLIHVVEATAKFDALICATKCTIALLRERRAALIAAAVSGRVEMEGAS